MQHPVPVHPALRGVVLEILADAPDVPARPAEYRVLPAPGPVIGFQYRGRLSVRRGEADELLDVGGITGIQSEVRRFLPRPETRTVLVRLTPLGGYRLFGCPMSEIADRHVPMDRVAPAAASAVRRVTGAAPDKVAQLVQGWLVEVMRRQGRHAHDDVAAAVERILVRGGGERVRDVAGALGVGRRHLERLFRQQVGVGPKEFASLARFHHVLERVGQRRAWADVALEAGFADQSHFIRSFKRRAGVTPGEYEAACRSDAAGTRA